MTTLRFTRSLTTMRAHPGLAIMLLLTAAAGTYYLAAQAQAVYVTPDPQVVLMPLGWQKHPEPVANAGVDIQKRTLDQFIAAGGAPKDYEPVSKNVFKAGESLWSLRYECFLNKTQDGVISRAFLGGDGSAGTNRSVVGLLDMQIPTRTDGCAVKNHRTLIPSDLPPGIWTYQVSVNFYKSPPQPNVRVLLRPLVIEVTP